MPDQQPRLFHLQRDTDITGISGTGTVAHGVQWPDGTVTIRWTGDMPSTVNWGSIDHAIHVHGHGGHTRVIWADGQPVPADAVRDLAIRLAEDHRPKLDPDTLADPAVRQYRVSCLACTPGWYVLWRVGGGPLPTCELWTAAVEHGLVEPATGPTA